MGGMGWQGSASYYRVMNRAVRARLGGFHSARVILDSFDFHSIASAQSKEDFEEVAATMVASALRLQAAGAELLAIACNTVHRLAPAVEEAIDIPFLHIADASGDALNRDQHTRVGLLGTRATIESGFYRKRLAASMGLDIVLPDQDQRALVDEMISKELAAGENPEACAPRLDRMVASFAETGCTAVLLACTEFGLAYGASDDPVLERALPLYDTAVLHALQVVEMALD